MLNICCCFTDLGWRPVWVLSGEGSKKKKEQTLHRKQTCISLSECPQMRSQMEFVPSPSFLVTVLICVLMKNYIFPHGIPKAFAAMSDVPSQCANPRAPKSMLFTVDGKWWPQDSPAQLYRLKGRSVSWPERGQRGQSQNALSAFVTVVP